MKTAYVIIFSTMIIIGGFVLSHSFTNIRPVKSAPETIATPIPTVPPSPTSIPTSSPLGAEPNKTQIIQATYGPPFGFIPNEFTVKAGQPVRLEVKAIESGRGCMGSITIPGLNDEVQVFKQGQTNVFEFTPQVPGTYPITCAMGIPHGNIIVK